MSPFALHDHSYQFSFSRLDGNRLSTNIADHSYSERSLRSNRQTSENRESFVRTNATARTFPSPSSFVIVRSLASSTTVSVRRPVTSPSTPPTISFARRSAATSAQPPPQVISQSNNTSSVSSVPMATKPTLYLHSLRRPIQACQQSFSQVHLTPQIAFPSTRLIPWTSAAREPMNLVKRSMKTNQQKLIKYPSYFQITRHFVTTRIICRTADE